MSAPTETVDYSDPCTKVRTSCRKWMEEEPLCQASGRRSVAFFSEHLPALAETILRKAEATSSGSVEWDEENWHYQGKQFKGSEELRKERVALYILALDAINFCFWPHEHYPQVKDINTLEYEHLAVALKQLAELDDAASNNDDYVFSPRSLANMTEESMKQMLTPHLQGHFLDNMKKRSELIKEVGTVLVEEFEGSVMNMIARANHSAPTLVSLIFEYFPGFRDEVWLNGSSSSSSERIVLLKRAQIFVGDVNAALQLHLQDIDQLTTFADYRVPQVLRHYGILEYAPALATQVDAGNEVQKGSTDEVSIRAATVYAVEKLVTYLQDDSNRGSSTVAKDAFTDVSVDWSLWQIGEQMHRDGLLRPFHKVKTHFY
eukprot:Nitzschia sp. Nitz4//scaffold13_size275219//152013//153137//NITZ4_000883-RA/size275219-processed-gene-0.148-mRNA-1//-1//CDS//3329536041//3583//frame0